MKKRLRKWLGITRLFSLFTAQSRRIDELEKRLVETEERLTELDGRLAQKPIAKPQPVRLKTWSEAKKILEQGEEINAAR